MCRAEPFYSVALGILAVASLASCNNESTLGTLSVSKNDRIVLNAKFPKNYTPWRIALRTEPDAAYQWLKDSDRIVIYLENKDSLLLKASGLSENGIQDIQPGHSVKAYDGPLAKLVHPGPNERIRLVLDSTMERDVDANIILEFHLSSEPVPTIRVLRFYDRQGP